MARQRQSLAPAPAHWPVRRMGILFTPGPSCPTQQCSLSLQGIWLQFEDSGTQVLGVSVMKPLQESGDCTEVCESKFCPCTLGRGKCNSKASTDALLPAPWPTGPGRVLHGKSWRMSHLLPLPCSVLSSEDPLAQGPLLFSLPHSFCPCQPCRSKYFR